MKIINREYQVWCWKAPYSDEPNGWSVQYFTDSKEAQEYADRTVADEIHIEGYQDKAWHNDHIVKQALGSLQVY
jgi:hypothetical protein